MDFLEQLNGLVGKLDERLNHISSEAELEAARVEFLGRKGQLAELMSHMRELAPEQRPAFGQAANAVKERLVELFEARLARQEQENPHHAHRLGDYRCQRDPRNPHSHCSCE